MGTIRHRALRRAAIRRALAAELRKIPAALGDNETTTALSRQVLLRVGVALLVQIKRDFQTKARGGTGRDGVTWAPHAASTIRRRLKKEAKLRRGRRKKAHPMAGKVEIGRDTGRMDRSLSPGMEDQPSGAPGQVFEVTADAVSVGTNVPYAKRFHEGGQSPNQPARSLWPADGSIPAEWWPAIMRAAKRGVALAIAEGLRRRGL